LQPGELSTEQLDRYYSTAIEADNRIWKHATQSQADKVLIYSPDTDVYNIGLSYINHCTTTSYTVQLNTLPSGEEKYINLNNLSAALLKDPDLCNLQQKGLCQIFQSLFICTGYDYISYSKSVGKATVQNVFFPTCNIYNWMQYDRMHTQHFTNRQRNWLFVFHKTCRNTLFQKAFGCFCGTERPQNPKAFI